MQINAGFTSSVGSSTEVLFMYLIERGYCIIMLAQDEIDGNEAERLEHVAEISLIYRKCWLYYTVSTDEIQNVICCTRTACRICRDVSVRKSSLFYTVSTGQDWLRWNRTPRACSRNVFVWKSWLYYNVSTGRDSKCNKPNTSVQHVAEMSLLERVDVASFCSWRYVKRQSPLRPPSVRSEELKAMVVKQQGASERARVRDDCTFNAIPKIKSNYGTQKPKTLVC